MRPEPHVLLAHGDFLRRLARSLVRDEHAAEDMVQETMARAVSDPPSRGSLRRWSATVLKNLVSNWRRSEGRRRRREAGGRDVPCVPSAAEIVQREELRHQVVQCVLSLEEPYRSVVLLRYFEDLTPGEIARHLGVPAARVRIRLHRAHGMLRARLDERHRGDRGAWMAILLPLARRSRALPATASPAALVLMVILMKKLGAVAIAAALAVLAWFVVLAPQQPEVQPPVASPPSAQAPATNPMTPRDADGAQVEETAREEVTPPGAAGAGTGSLLVRVTDDDGLPAVDVPVFVVRTGTGSRPVAEWTARTGPDGEARFDELPPVRLTVKTGRHTNGSSEAVEIETGAESEVELLLSMGTTVTGVVVDGQGTPVPGADIVVAGWASERSRVLAQSDADGRFEVRAILPFSSIGARAGGHAPSMLQGLTGNDGETLEIRIVLPDGGGSLVCRVLDPKGEPVQGALVRTGVEGHHNRPEKMADGSYAVRVPWEERTDREGIARFDGLPSGTVPVAAWKGGLAGWRGSAEVLPGPAQELVIRLGHGVTVIGTVRNSEGEPLAGSRVVVGRWGELAHQSVRTGDDGRYRIEGLPSGDLQVEVRGSSFFERATLAAVPGQVLRWDPEIATGQDVPGRVLGPEGEGLAGASLEGYARGQGGWTVHVRADDEGRFTLPNVPPDRLLRLTVRYKSMFPVSAFEGRPPREGELILRVRAEELPSAHLTGALVDLDGEPVPNAQISPHLRGHGGSPVGKPEADGTFDVGPLPPGEYCLSIRAKGWANVRTPWRRLAPGEVADLGRIRLEVPGTLMVHLVSAAALPEELRLSVFDGDSGNYVDRFEVREGTGSLGGLASGSYRLQVWGTAIHSTVVPFAIRSGVETRIDVPVRPGVPAALAIVPAEGAELPRSVELRVRDAAGELVVATSSSLREDGTLYRELAFAPGTYRASVEAGERRGEAAIEVPADSERIRVALPIR